MNSMKNSDLIYMASIVASTKSTANSAKFILEMSANLPTRHATQLMNSETNSTTLFAQNTREKRTLQKSIIEHTEKTIRNAINL